LISFLCKKKLAKITIGCVDLILLFLSLRGTKQSHLLNQIAVRLFVRRNDKLIMKMSFEAVLREG